MIMSGEEEWVEVEEVREVARGFVDKGMIPVEEGEFDEGGWVVP